MSPILPNFESRICACSANVLDIMGKLYRTLFYLMLLALIPANANFLQAGAGPDAPKVGLVLSGGGARAASHIGVLKVFEREHIPIDCIAGTSFGALIGGLYAIGYSAAEIERIISSQDWNSMFTSAPRRRFTPLIERRDARYQGQISFKGWIPELPSGLWGGQRLTETLDLLTAAPMLHARYDFDRLPIPFRAVATDLTDGKPYVFSQGSLTEALRASMAIPLLFTPLKKDGMLLVDGGLTDNLPTEIARAMGAEIIIAVDASTPLLTSDGIQSFFDVADQSISLQIVRNTQESRKQASVVLQPSLEEYKYFDYELVPEIIKQGEEEAERQLPQVKTLVEGIQFRPHEALPKRVPSIIDSISFQGLKRIRAAQMAANLRVHPGENADPSVIGADVSRLYATRLFDSVEYKLEPLDGGRCRLVFVVKEAALRTLGASLRYDNNYNFVALAEFTARQMFHSPSVATISAQLGGLEDYYASLRFISPSAQFFFVEPKAEVTRIERRDYRDQELTDKFRDEREGGQFTLGGSIARQIEISSGYFAERVRISGGTAPKLISGTSVLTGLTFRLYRDTLDNQELPRNGMTLRLQLDKLSSSLGGDWDYSKVQADYQRYFPVSQKDTLQIHASGGFSRGQVPFYDLFFIGGYSLSERASRRFLGLEYDELSVNQMAIVGASYRRQIFSRPLSFIQQGFLIGAYNGVFSSTRTSSPYRFNYLNGGGLGLAFDTMIGPFFAAGGWGERGRFNFYISFGPAF